MTTDTSEHGLESHISQYLVDEQSYLLRENSDYDNVNCIDKELLFRFLENTQPKAIAKIRQYHKELWKEKVVSLINKRITDQSLVKEMPIGGVINLFRKGIVDGHTNTKLQLFFDKPVSVYNEAALKLYDDNLFSVMRQVHFSPKNKKSLDMMVFINGIPIISFELKNELTHQTVQHAINQYKDDRDPNEEIFRLGRLIVNLAVDSEEVWMCTHLRKEKSYFLPFNKGFKNGA